MATWFQLSCILSSITLLTISIPFWPSLSHSTKSPLSRIRSSTTLTNWCFSLQTMTLRAALASTLNLRRCFYASSASSSKQNNLRSPNAYQTSLLTLILLKWKTQERSVQLAKKSMKRPISWISPNSTISLILNQIYQIKWILETQILKAACSLHQKWCSKYHTHSSVICSTINLWEYELASSKNATVVASLTSTSFASPLFKINLMSTARA